MMSQRKMVVEFCGDFVFLFGLCMVVLECGRDSCYDNVFILL